MFGGEFNRQLASLDKCTHLIKVHLHLGGGGGGAALKWLLNGGLCLIEVERWPQQQV